MRITGLLCILLLLAGFRVAPAMQPAMKGVGLPAVASVEGSEEEIVITPGDIGPFCPHQLVSGDREFSGHGPKVNISVSLVNLKNQALAVHIEFDAKETQSNWSEVKGSWQQVIYRAPAGKMIAGILSGSASYVRNYICPAAEADLFGCDGPVLKPGIDGTGPVKEIRIVGDTSGDDISDDDDCTCDTRIVKITFLPVKLKLMPVVNHR